jgi:hypothetical protein
MIPRPIRLALALFVLVGSLGAPGRAGAEGADTILRRSAAEVDEPSILGPTRQQGDFGEHLDELLAAAEPPDTDAAADSAAAPQATGIAVERQPPGILPVLGGAVGGAAGLYGGILIGLALDPDDGGEWDGVFAALTGGFIGEIVGMPLGTHLSNGRKGSFLADLGISALMGLAGLGVLALADGSTGGVVAGAGLQLIGVVLTERSTARKRIEERRAAAAGAR